MRMWVLFFILSLLLFVGGLKKEDKDTTNFGGFACCMSGIVIVIELALRVFAWLLSW